MSAIGIVRVRHPHTVSHWNCSKGRTISGIIYDHYCSFAEKHANELWQPVPLDPSVASPADGASAAKRPKLENSSKKLPTRPPHCKQLTSKRKFRALWVSTGWDLHADAIRDLNAVCGTDFESKKGKKQKQ